MLEVDLEKESVASLNIYGNVKAIQRARTSDTYLQYFAKLSCYDPLLFAHFISPESKFAIGSKLIDSDTVFNRKLQHIIC
jgi:hypothetical protein